MAEIQAYFLLEQQDREVEEENRQQTEKFKKQGEGKDGPPTFG